MPIQELMISELPALPPVPSGEIHVSQMNGTARVTCKATVQELVQSVAPRTHSHTPADIGLGNVNNGNWVWTNSAPALEALDVIRFYRAPGIIPPGVDWVAMKMNA